ncbi:hypothetical protein [Burkholderia vietnamiensis]|uniref:hypothetical protein n=1 Tax=Burkholderia vietnamiensis TaxID=60552 RepID=UPI0012DB755C|nr:hypothetical protein [Burkholderia vietnamiensis]
MKQNSIVTAFLTDDNAMFDCLSRPITSGEWHEAFRLTAAECQKNEANREACHTRWVTHGARIREGVANDVLLSEFLRAILPPYTGSSMTLFRGESAERFTAGRIGLCWTSQRDTGTRFGRGLNALYEGGGLLLSATVDASAIIAGPGRHSNWLGEAEYTVDPAAINKITVLERFPHLRLSSTGGDVDE